MKRAFVTGGSGFIGANLVRRLLDDGHEVHLLLRAGHQAWRLEQVKQRCRILSGDITDREAIRRALSESRPDWVFNLAAWGAYSSQTGFDRMVEVNLLGCAALLDECARLGVEAFIQAGSSSEYGYKQASTRESDLLQPNSHYAIAKAAATHYCQFTARIRELPVVVLRLYSAYGPWEEPARLVPSLLIHGLAQRVPPLVSPSTARDFIHVDDVVEAFLLTAAHGHLPPGSVYNVATGIQTSIAELVQEARRILKIPAEPVWGGMEPRPWDTDTWVGDAVALQTDTAWRARVSLAEGLTRTIDWLERNPRCLEEYRRRILGSQP
jgi:nucleoside-diphosphate-sugar epimerase